MGEDVLSILSVLPTWTQLLDYDVRPDGSWKWGTELGKVVPVLTWALGLFLSLFTRIRD